MAECRDRLRAAVGETIGALHAVDRLVDAPFAGEHRAERPMRHPEVGFEVKDALQSFACLVAPAGGPQRPAVERERDQRLWVELASGPHLLLGVRMTVERVEQPAVAEVRVVFVRVQRDRLAEGRVRALPAPVVPELVPAPAAVAVRELRCDLDRAVRVELRAGEDEARFGSAPKIMRRFDSASPARASAKSGSRAMACR